MTIKTAVIHTDGACSGNPGPGGFAAIIVVEEPPCRHITVTGGDPRTTSSRMELSAVIEAIKLVNGLPDAEQWDITARSDSKYVVDAFNQGWLSNWQRNGWRKANKKPVANRDLWERLLDATAPNHMTFQWVKGHSGDPMNAGWRGLPAANSPSRCFRSLTKRSQGKRRLP